MEYITIEIEQIGPATRIWNFDIECRILNESSTLHIHLPNCLLPSNELPISDVRFSGYFGGTIQYSSNYQGRTSQMLAFSGDPNQNATYHWNYDALIFSIYLRIPYTDQGSSLGPGQMIHMNLSLKDGCSDPFQSCFWDPVTEFVNNTTSELEIYGCDAAVELFTTATTVVACQNQITACVAACEAAGLGPEDPASDVCAAAICPGLYNQCVAYVEGTGQAVTAATCQGIVNNLAS